MPNSRETIDVYQNAFTALKPFLGQENAKKYALFAQDVYNYIENDPSLQAALVQYKNWKDGRDITEGINKIETANKYLSKVVPEARTGFLNYRAEGASNILKVFVDRFETLAEHKGIELNQCALMVTKVSLDIGTAGVGAVGSVTPFGWVLVGWGVISTFKDSYALGTACFVSPAGTRK